MPLQQIQDQNTILQKLNDVQQAVQMRNTMSNIPQMPQTTSQIVEEIINPLPETDNNFNLNGGGSIGK